MNPYAPNLQGRAPLPVIAATPRLLRDCIEALGPESVERPIAPGKWSPREILCHLADTELVFAFRLRQTLAEPNYTVQPFDQAKWAATYSAFAAEAAMSVFAAVREWNVTLIQSIPPEAFNTPLTHPERGSMTFQVLVETMAGHDLNHLTVLESMAHQ